MAHLVGDQVAPLHLDEPFRSDRPELMQRHAQEASDLSLADARLAHEDAMPRRSADARRAES